MSNVLKCPVCSNAYKSADQVFLDDLNGVTHKDCYDGEARRIKDVGTYNEIINKYSFFKELR